MNDNLKSFLSVLALVALGALGTWWWYDNMELRWQSRRHISEAATKDRMLAATLLLRRNGRVVDGAGSLGELVLPKVAGGTMILSGASGTALPGQAQEMLDWVRRGNTLIAEPRSLTSAEKAALAALEPASDDEKDDEEDDEADATDKPASVPASAPGKAEARKEDKDEDEDEDLPPGKPAPASSFAAAADGDPLTDRYGARVRRDAKACRCRTQPAEADKDKPEAIAAARRERDKTVSRLTLPGKSYALELDGDMEELVSLPGATAPLWSDDDGGAVRVYREGKGQVVLLTTDYFNNYQLDERDHGELLLALTELAPGRHVTIVRNLNVLPWYKALWRYYSLFLVSLAVGLALMFWAAVRRFGPIVPAPKAERRSLLEHIDASGAWLWKADGGRQVLLDAARDDTLALIRRRAPALFRMPESELWAILARDCALLDADVIEALEQDAASHVTRFTRQIRTLQELRNHYER
ncbi:DUF4350 domain-containing protein [Massilia antarctica]|uniref:DUF4350 domain-containing protein n=1 Tax=Massilia antarctica TaxID=2765360 RepID=UPI0006BB90C3|nr:DUF4350 domain-containing protein [Massilia sp. H27-R4]MCY0916077.1 DUF4350 domain-containing protein [Massilia sp. H27-R4]CUI08396.1 hypothetical protein BN2497_11569 [Janthinobacterium sp. CG23_2]CUU32182.1 hypothetical protein BN3177_11569 [Janthinobacterium sp. CG23_2]